MDGGFVVAPSVGAAAACVWPLLVRKAIRTGIRVGGGSRGGWGVDAREVEEVVGAVDWLRCAARNGMKVTNPGCCCCG